MPLFGDYSPSSSETSIYRKEFAAFCLPLIVFVGLSIFEQIADRWFLQMFSGSVKQGYYALAYQIGAICFLFTSAFIPLVLREQSISFGKNDHQALRYIFMRFIPMLYTLTAFFCCFIVIEARQVLHFFGGSAYAGALVPLMIMCLFPIHQTYGQLNTNMFFATERVKTYRNIGLVFIAIGLPTTLFLLGPRTYGCLQLGAMGLAVKMVVINILSTNVQLWFNTRYLGLSYKELLIHQILTVAVLLVLAWGTSLGIRYVVNDNHYIVQFVLSGMMYSMLAGILAFMVPGIFKVQRSDFIRFYEFFRRKWAAQTS